MKVSYRLPFPPPLSALTKNIGRYGRAATKRYQAWTEDALWSLKQQGAKPFGARCYVCIGLESPDKRRRDASNHIKAIEDVLVKAGVIEDDSIDYERGCFAYWLDQRGKECIVTLLCCETYEVCDVIPTTAARSIRCNPR